MKKEEQVEMKLEYDDGTPAEPWDEEYKEKLALDFKETIRLFRESGEVDFQKFCTKLEKEQKDD